MWPGRKHAIPKKGFGRQLWAGAGAVLLALALWWLDRSGSRETPAPPSAADDANRELVLAHAGGRTRTWVGGRARVAKVLPDDLAPPRHQRFLVRVGDGLSVKISHNIDLAPRVPGLAEGTEVEYHGLYELGEHGAFVHWTHHDPSGRHSGGWLKVDGRTYR